MAQNITNANKDNVPRPLALEPDLLRAAWRRSYFGLSVAGIFSIFCNLLKTGDSAGMCCRFWTALLPVAASKRS